MNCSMMHRRRSAGFLGGAMIAAAIMTLWTQPVAAAAPQRAFVVTLGGQGEQGGTQRTIHITQGLGSGSYLGVRLEDISSENSSKLGLTKEEGALVQEVEKDSPAAAAGVLKGDVIVSYAGVPVFSAAQLVRLVSETPVGRRVEIAVWRSGKRVNLDAKIAARSEEDSTRHIELDRLGRNLRVMPRGAQGWGWNPLEGFFSATGKPRLGVSVVELTEQLAEKYGLKGKEGALVLSVSAGTPAERAGIKAGDVIVEIDGRMTNSADSIARALRRTGSRDVEIKIYRDRQPMTLKAQLETQESPEKSKSRVIL